MRVGQSVYTLNRGVVDRRALARVDVKKLQIAAQVQTNYMPRVFGTMGIRPGLKYLGATDDNNFARYLLHLFATDDFSLLELTDQSMRIWIGDSVLTRPAVTTAITNGTFSSDLSGWTDMDAGSAVSQWVSPGYMELKGDGTSRAIREQHVTTVETGTEHALRILIARGPVMLRVGSTSGDDDYISETVLYEGEHSLSFTPNGDFYVRFFSTYAYAVWVNSCTIESAGAVSISTPWRTSSFSKIRYDQSGDVIFVACKGLQQRRIERRGTRPGARSWSVVLYQSPDGPFNIQNTSAVTLSASAITGDITVTSSESMFKSDHVGALFSITSVGQTTTVNVSAENTFSTPVRVSGIGNDRIVTFTISGVFVGTVKVQRSFDGAVWTNVGGALVWTAPSNYAYNDTLDNQIVFYRIGINTGDYTSGTATCSASIASGSVRGIVRITSFTNSTTVGAQVLTDLGGTAASSVWQEGQWSDLNGWPTAVAIHEGRMWWAGLNGIWGSISDAYDSFDETFLGDAGTINRTIGAGPVDTINWILSLKGLITGAQGAEYTVRSSSLDEPLTPTNFNMKSSSTQGSGQVAALKIDQGGYYVDRTGCKVFELAFNIRNYDYDSTNLMELCPEIGLPGITRIAVQRKPDTRIHAVRSDGTAIVGVINISEEVMAWVPIETDGVIEDVVIAPAAAGDLDDQVYYVVARTVQNSTVRYLEKWAQEVDCRGDSLCYLADSYVSFSGTSTTTFSVPHLKNKDVVVWADGVDVGTDDSTTEWTQRYSVDDSGIVTLNSPASDVVIGLGYDATFQSSKLGLTMDGRSALNEQKRAVHLGMILADTHRRGVRFGADFDRMDDLPGIENGRPVTEEVREEYDENVFVFPGKWTTDLRVCLKSSAPRPATVMAFTLSDIEQN